jgi:TRAP transporter TAXI family solute receptor
MIVDHMSRFSSSSLCSFFSSCCSSFLVGALLLVAAKPVLAEQEITLPRSMSWSAYNLGTTGYNQAVAIGKVLKDKHGVNLRVIPGKNDISRFLPLKKGRVQFTATGVATYFAQEGMFQFAHRAWGPLPIRITMMSNGLSNQSVAVAKDTGVKEFSQLRGKRIPWVRGAPALNISTEAILACGGLTWDDVTKVEYPGYAAMWNGVVEDQIDVAYATTVSGPTRKLEASPRGIFWPPLPHADEGCWSRLRKIAPYFVPHIATRGAAISDSNPHEGATYPYPILVSLASQKDEMVYSLAKAIHLGYEDFKDADPGAIGWALSLQQFDWVVPYHGAAVKYYKELGVWTTEHSVHNDKLIERQEVLGDAWQTLQDLNIEDDDEFASLWLQFRKLKLSAAGFDPIW